MDTTKTTMKITPVEKYLLVEEALPKVENDTIFIPEVTNKDYIVCNIVKSNNSIFEEGKKVLFHKSKGLKIEGKKIIIKEEDVLAIVEY